MDDILSPLLSLEPMPYKSSAGKTNGVCVCVCILKQNAHFGVHFVQLPH